MTDPSRPQQCVVAFDLSPSSEFALTHAIDLAAREPNHALHILAALDPHDRLSLLLAGEAANIAAADRIRAMVDRHVTAALAHRATMISYTVHVRIGKASTEILALAAEVGADVIFVGSHGNTGFERFLLGSVSERVVREALCPVTVARPKTYPDARLGPAFADERDREPVLHCPIV